MSNMGCSTSIRASDASSPTSSHPSVKQTGEKTFGKVSMFNGDGSLITSGTIVPVGERTQLFGRIQMNPTLKIRSDKDGITYDQANWVNNYRGKVKHKSVYASDPEAGKAYAEKVQRAAAAAAAAAAAPRTPVPHRTPRPVVPPVQRTVFGMHQPPPSTTLELLSPLPFKFDLPPLPLMITPPRLV